MGGSSESACVSAISRVHLWFFFFLCFVVAVCKLEGKRAVLAPVSSVCSVPTATPMGERSSPSVAAAVVAAVAAGSFLLLLRDLRASELLPLVEQRDLLVFSLGCWGGRQGSRVSIHTASRFPDRKKATQNTPRALPHGHMAQA